jgi:hypothetical protein
LKHAGRGRLEEYLIVIRGMLLSGRQKAIVIGGKGRKLKGKKSEAV